MSLYTDDVRLTFVFLVFCLYILKRSWFGLRTFMKIKIENFYWVQDWKWVYMYISSGFWSYTQIHFILKLNWLNPAADLMYVYLFIYIHVSMYMKICNTRVMDCINLSILDYEQNKIYKQIVCCSNKINTKYTKII